MNRIELRHLAEERVLDAKILLDAGRWSAAYYLAGYAMECGLKACILAYVEQTGAIFQDKRFSERCFTHKIMELVEVAGLLNSHIAMLDSNNTFAASWKIAKDWSEAARYQVRSEVDALKLFDAITNDPDGVLPWIRTNW